MIERLLTDRIVRDLSRYPAVAILGPRQVGKTTLARKVADQHDGLYLDLMNPDDAARLRDPSAFFASTDNQLVVLDEIQRSPEIFRQMRGVIDRRRDAGRRTASFLILGSASIELLKQSGESLAGRIDYLHLDPLNICEVGEDQVENLWVRGGYPDMFLETDDTLRNDLQRNIVATYLQRDTAEYGFRFPSETLRRMWTMIAHLQGSPVNHSDLARNLEISVTTINRYVDLLCDMFLLRRLQPFHTNTSKRLVKNPRIYIRDSGLTHHLLGISNLQALLGHPIVGGSWESFVIENILSVTPPEVLPSFFRTSRGAEIDLVLEWPNGDKWAIEIKRSQSSSLSEGFYEAVEIVGATRRILVHGGRDDFPYSDTIEAKSLNSVCHDLAAVSS